jgi:hypothetical protein
MSLVRRLLAHALSIVLLTPPLVALQPPEPQNEFRPLDEIPAAEALPGGAFVVVAYAFVWVAAMVYIWSIWRRLGKVEDEMRALRRRSGSGPQ